MHACARHHRPPAFTILEVLLAAAIMLATVVGLMQVIGSGSEMLEVSRQQAIATEIIHGEIDRVHLSNWTTVSALPASASITIGARLQGGGAGFSCTRTVASVKGDLKLITFTVTWTCSTGRSYTRAGSTYVGKDGKHVTTQRT